MGTGNVSRTRIPLRAASAALTVPLCVSVDELATGKSAACWVPTPGRALFSVRAARSCFLPGLPGAGCRTGPPPRPCVPRACPQGPVQRGRLGHWQPPLVPDGSVRRDVGRDPGTEQSHAHGEHFLGEHITQQRDLASQLEVADGRTGRACHVADEGTGQAVRVDVSPVLDASSRQSGDRSPQKPGGQRGAWPAGSRISPPRPVLASQVSCASCHSVSPPEWADAAGPASRKADDARTAVARVGTRPSALARGAERAASGSRRGPEPRPCVRVPLPQGDVGFRFRQREASFSGLLLTRPEPLRLLSGPRRSRSSWESSSRSRRPLSTSSLPVGRSRRSRRSQRSRPRPRSECSGGFELCAQGGAGPSAPTTPPQRPSSVLAVLTACPGWF